MGEVSTLNFERARNPRKDLWTVEAVYHIDPRYSLIRLKEVKDHSVRHMQIAYCASDLPCSIEQGYKLEFTPKKHPKGFDEHVDMGEGIGCVIIAGALNVWKPWVVYMTGWVKINQRAEQTTFQPR